MSAPNHDARVREGHSKAMEALGADVHPYSASAIRDWEAQLDEALAALLAEPYAASVLRAALSGSADTTETA